MQPASPDPDHRNLLVGAAVGLLLLALMPLLARRIGPLVPGSSGSSGPAELARAGVEEAGERLAALEARRERRERDWKTLCAARDEGTPESRALLLDALEGEDFELEQVVDALWPHVLAPTGRGAWLVGERRFEQALSVRLAHHANWLRRGQFAQAAGRLGWTRAAPRLRELVDDENLAVRRRAAEALRRLTGELVAFEVPALSFPHDAAGADELGARQESDSPAPLEGVTAASFLRGAEGTRRLALVRGARLELPGGEGVAAATVALPCEALDVLDVAFAGGTRRLVVFAPGHSGGQRAERVVGLDPAGEIRWEHAPEGGAVRAAAVLHGEAGAYGLVIAGRDELVALDADGRELWRRAHEGTLYALATHPDVPGVLLAATGELAAFEHGPTGCAPAAKARPSGGMLHVRHALPFPGPRGVAAVVAGVDALSVPAVARTALDGERAWTAVLPDPVEDLVRMDTRSGATFFAALTRAGDVHVFDVEGTRLASRSVDLVARGGSRELRAGRAAGGWTLAVRCGRTVQRIELDLEALVVR